MNGKRDRKPKPRARAAKTPSAIATSTAKPSPAARTKRAARGAEIAMPAPIVVEATLEPAQKNDFGIADAVREADALLKSAADATARAPVPTVPKLSTAEVEERIRELESRLDAMIEAAASQTSLPTFGDADGDGPMETESAEAPRAWSAGDSGAAPDTSTPVPAPLSVPPPSRASVTPSAPPSRALAAETEPTAFDTARDLLSTDFYLRKWGRLGLRNRSEEVDDFGYDPIYETRVKPFLDFLYSKYFRVEARGVDRIPAEGRCLLVANHSGTLPFDGLMIRAAVKRLHSQARDVRWLAEDFIFHFPFIGSLTTRIGAVRACQENAGRLLRQDALVAVFPEGMKGTGKLFRDRYRLQRFGRGGFVKLALRTQTPIVPVAVLGGEETQPLLARLDRLGKLLGFPYVPITPLFPLLGPLGLAPAPTKWRIVFGEPIRFKEGPEGADDELLVGRLGEHVRGTIQEMVDELVRARRSVFFG